MNTKLLWFLGGIAACLSLGGFMPLCQWLGVPDAAFWVWLSLMTFAMPISMAGINGLLPKGVIT